jgi:hypothetical protein
MTEIKRYDLVTVGSDWHCIDRMEQRPDGDWVRWEDVENYLKDWVPKSDVQKIVQFANELGSKVPKNNQVKIWID